MTSQLSVKLGRARVQCSVATRFLWSVAAPRRQVRAVWALRRLVYCEADTNMATIPNTITLINNMAVLGN
jgi:hypothetical protein